MISLFDSFNTMLYFILHFLLQYAWRMAYPMAWHRGTSHCTPLLSSFSTLVSVRIEYCFGKVSISVTRRFLRETRKRERIVRGSCEEKQKLQVFNPHEMTNSLLPFYSRIAATGIVSVTFVPPFFAPVTNQIESLFVDIAIGSLLRFRESLKRISA